jgi:hypothetical protein
LDLARWLVAAENPLTARVTVNRVWQMFFGTGLVKSVEDFGVQGEKPSHPELLDWLAVEFIESGWDLKYLCKLIVMSQTYRRSSEATAEQRELDPENRWLARGSRYRWPSWMIRDSALAASGLLVDRFGRPSVKPYQPEGIWEEATFGKKIYEQDHGEALYRRSLYIYWRRIVGPTMLFDNAARQVCTVKVSRTNTPLHSLTTLNDIAYVEAARGLAQRVMQEATTVSSRIQLTFRLVIGRLPESVECELLRDRFRWLHAQYEKDRGAAVRLKAIGESRVPAGIDDVDLAAYTGLCSLIMNLDEALSRE